MQSNSSLWGTRELVSSMDCLLVWRPWARQPARRPVTEGLHLDQNPFHRWPEPSSPRRGLQCVQGMVPLLPVTRQV